MNAKADPVASPAPPPPPATGPKFFRFHMFMFLPKSTHVRGRRPFNGKSWNSSWNGCKNNVFTSTLMVSHHKKSQTIKIKVNRCINIYLLVNLFTIDTFSLYFSFAFIHTNIYLIILYLLIFFDSFETFYYANPLYWK